MLNVQISTASGVKQILATDGPLKIRELRDQMEGLTVRTAYPNLEPRRSTDDPPFIGACTPLQDNFYFIHNGKLVDENSTCYEGYISIVPRLVGGKGGFGSMLRAIGAQIEKTTNREACRDLSGRRLRDINEEKRLKAWIEKQGKREEEAAERKKKKLERLCAEPRHEFKDQTYERERSALTERVGDAVEEGFKAATSGVKRKPEEEEAKPIKKKLLLDLEIDSDDLDSSDESDEEEKKSENIGKRTEQTSTDSGHSSDESGASKTDRNKKEDKAFETNSDAESSSKSSDDVGNNEKTIRNG